jgi:hypothetical protein
MALLIVSLGSRSIGEPRWQPRGSLRFAWFRCVFQASGYENMLDGRLRLGKLCHFRAVNINQTLNDFISFQNRSWESRGWNKPLGGVVRAKLSVSQLDPWTDKSVINLITRTWQLEAIGPFYLLHGLTIQFSGASSHRHWT